DQGVGEQVWLKAEFHHAGVHDVVVVPLLLNPRIREVIDRHLLRTDPGDCLGHLRDRQRLGHLVEDPELAGLGRIFAGQLQAAHRIPDLYDAANLAAIAVDAERLADHRLDHEPVQYRAENRVVVVPGRQPVVLGGLRRLLAVDDSLVEIGGPDPPDPAGELDVVAVVHLGQVVVGTGPFRIKHTVLAALVLDLDPALLDVDVRRAVSAHGAELDQVDAGIDLGDRVEHVHRADDVVDLGIDGVLAVDHRVRRGPLLGVVDNRVGPEVAHHVKGK